MSENSKASFNLDDFKELKKQMEKKYAEAKTQYDENKTSGEESPKQSVGNKVIGIIILIAILGIVIYVVISNLELIFLPKNSVTIVVRDQNGDVIEGLRLYASSTNHSFTVEFDENGSTNVTELGVKSGDYTLIFENIPKNYNCDKTIDRFTMAEGDKVKLKYECTKGN